MNTPKLNKTHDGIYYIYNHRRKVYLGKGDKDVIRARYHAFLLNYFNTKDGEKQEIIYTFSVKDLRDKFVKVHTNYYANSNGQTRQLDRIKTAMSFPVALYQDVPVDEFRAKRLDECRELMIQSGRFSRTYINTLVSCIRRVFAWGVEQELVLPETLISLKALTCLKRGRTTAREPEPIASVSSETVEKTLPFLHEPVRSMVVIQRHTGMRPGEIVSMRKRDVQESEFGFIYTLAHDKTDYRRAANDKRVVLIGVVAATALKPFLENIADDDFVFSSNAKTNQRYSRCAYARAITRAAKRAGVPSWTPNQIRHLFATEVRARFGLDAAQVILGHKHANVTQIYAERNLSLAGAVIQELG